MPEISLSAKSVPPSSIRKFMPFIDLARKSGKKVYPLHIGQPDLKSPQEYFDALRHYEWKEDLKEGFTESTVAYAKSGGLDAYRTALTEYYALYDIILKPDNIIITMGGSEALEMAFKIVADPGEKIVTPEPFFLAYFSRVQSESRKLLPITTSIDDNFQLKDFKPKLEDIIRKEKGVKAILINSPNNPTGAVYDLEQMKAVADCAKEHNLFVISDEVYREICFGCEPHISAMHFPGLEDNVIMVDSDSKRYNLCGARLGRIVSKNPKVMNAAMKLAQIRLSVSTTEQLGGMAVLGNKHYIQSVKEEYLKRRNVAREVISGGEGIKFSRPDGAFYMMVDLGNHLNGEKVDAEEFAWYMLQEFDKDGKTTSSAPAGEFYVNKKLGKSQVRLAFVINEDALRDACSVFLEGIYSFKEWKKAHPENGYIKACDALEILR
ncbi:pyridoxal phosphate-dependent aminotransferase [Candidatus Woesearchaeota archaeon]|nr:pyridoxal phosphate-dependent aminotransferase [Candidatus Woesearchaeota archaeon]